MASVWKRLQRVNKRAAKFQYTVSYHRVDLETASPKWKPNKLSVVFTRRSRRVTTEPVEWEPSLKDPLKGSVIYTVPENHTVAVTLFKDARTNELEDKDWTFVLEDVSITGKRRRLASCAVNMCKWASVGASQRALQLPLEPGSRKVRAAALRLTVHCVLLREGHATDEDMQSLASLLSVNNNSDVAVLEDLDEDDYTLSDHSTRQMSDLRQQMEEMTQSLTNSDLAATPNSVQSLNFDNSRTPTAPMTPATPAPDGETTPTHDHNDTTNNDARPQLHYLSNLTKTAMKSEPPKFSSTPNNSTTTVDTTIDNFKGVVFKPKTIAKRNLKPLELKSNFNIALDGLENGNGRDEDSDKTPTGDNNVDRFLSEKQNTDKTPVQDLLEWCQWATREYKSCRITNLTTSFRSGIAFCAIIHNYRPDLIDFSGLQPEEAERNVRTALEASARLGIAQVLTVADVCARPVPDRLAIMTYLFQLRAHFTGSELQVEQLGNDETESSYLVGRHDTDAALPAELFSREVATRRSRNVPERARPRPLSSGQESQESRNSQERRTPESTGSGGVSGVGGVSGSSGVTGVGRESLLQQSRTLLGKVLSPQRDSSKPTARWFDDPLCVTECSNPAAAPPPPTPPRPARLMTRRELTDPFASDDEEDAPTPGNGTGSGSGTGTGDTAKPDQLPTEAPTAAQTNEQTTAQIEPNSAEDSRSDPTSADHSAPMSPTAELPKPTPQLLSRHDELKERARQLLEATKREAREKEKSRRQNSKEKEEASKEANGLRNGEMSPKKPLTEAERQAVLRERARRLIADARLARCSPATSSPTRRGAGAVEVISQQSVMEEIAAAGGMERLEAALSGSGGGSEPCSPGAGWRRSAGSVGSAEERSSASGGAEGGRGARSLSPSPPPLSPTPVPAPPRTSPLRSFSALVERLTPDKDAPAEAPESGSYIASELEALEREQAAVDERAANLEKRLRQVMGGGGGAHCEHKWRRYIAPCVAPPTDPEEDKLMSQWFNLVNKKNALLRRQMQLNILEQEEDLSRRCELLARELRLSLGVDDWRKTPGQKRRERLLLQELVAAVNERDRLVREMDEQEKAIADDDEIQRHLSNVEIQRKNNCLLQ